MFREFRRKFKWKKVQKGEFQSNSSNVFDLKGFNDIISHILHYLHDQLINTLILSLVKAVDFKQDIDLRLSSWIG